MSIAGTWTFDTQLELTAVMSEFEKLVQRFPRFRQKLSQNKWRGWNWIDDRAFDLKYHVEHIKLDAPGTHHQLTEVLGNLASMSFDLNHSPWKAHLITGLNGGGCALFTRLHHVITDGQGSVRTLLTLTSTKDNLNDSKFTKKTNPSLFTSLLPKLLLWPFYLIYFSMVMLYNLAIVARKGAYVLWYKRKTFLPKTRVVAAGKCVDWSQNFPLEDVKTMKNNLGCTVNDVLVAILTGALRRHLSKVNQLVEDDLLFFVPVSMRKMDDWSLGNKVSTVMVWLPIHEKTPLGRLNSCKKRLDALKRSPEAQWYYAFYAYFGNFVFFPDFLINWYMNKSSGVFSNVPGPRDALYFAGHKITSYIPLIPQSNGYGGLGLGLLSYDEKVVFSAYADKSVFGEQGLQELIHEFEEEYAVFKDQFLQTTK